MMMVVVVVPLTVRFLIDSQTICIVSLHGAVNMLWAEMQG